jgi:HSP20 family protein
VPCDCEAFAVKITLGSSQRRAASRQSHETDKEYLDRAQLPAVKKEDVKVSVSGGMLTIEGERKQDKDEKNEHFHRVESFHGTFTRSFTLPENANSDAIHCESLDGVLVVHIPKKDTTEAKPKQIKID